MIWTLDIIECHRVVEISRYLIGTAPAVYLLAGYGLYSLSLQNKQQYILLALCHGIFCLINNAYLHLIPQKENWREVAKLIETNGNSNSVLFVNPYYNIVCLDRYLQKPFRQIGIDNNTGISVIQKTIDHDKEQLPQNTIFWILSAQNGDTIFNTIPGKYKLLQKYDFPHALHLRKYQYNND